MSLDLTSLVIVNIALHKNTGVYAEWAKWHKGHFSDSSPVKSQFFLTEVEPNIIVTYLLWVASMMHFCPKRAIKA